MNVMWLMGHFGLFVSSFVIFEWRCQGFWKAPGKFGFIIGFEHCCCYFCFSCSCWIWALKCMAAWPVMLACWPWLAVEFASWLSPFSYVWHLRAFGLYGGCPLSALVIARATFWEFGRPEARWERLCCGSGASLPGSRMCRAFGSSLVLQYRRESRRHEHRWQLESK